jgi:hypothetical protein
LSGFGASQVDSDKDEDGEEVEEKHYSRFNETHFNSMSNLKHYKRLSLHQ